MAMQKSFNQGGNTVGLEFALVEDKLVSEFAVVELVE